MGCKKQGAKKQLVIVQKEKRQPRTFFSGSQTDPCFQNKNSGCRLTGLQCKGFGSILKDLNKYVF